MFEMDDIENSPFEIPFLSPGKLEKFKLDCVIENGLNDEKGCFYACMDKKTGLMKEDGTYNEDIIFSKAKSEESRSDMKKKFEETMKKCKDEAGNDVCKVAACINSQPRNFYV